MTFQNFTQLAVGMCSLTLLFASCKTGSTPATLPSDTIQTTIYDARNINTISTENMNKTVRPQDDFFEYANGNWIKNNPVPASESRWGSFNELDKQNKDILRSILSNYASNQSEKGSQRQLLGDFYSSYMNVVERNKQGDASLKEKIAKVNGILSREDLNRMLAEMSKTGISVVFSFGVGQDMKNVNEHITYCGTGDLGLPNRDYYTEDNKKDIVEKYKVHIQKCFVMLGNSEVNAKKMATQAFEIEKELAVSKLTQAQSRLPEKTYNPKSIAELKIILGNVDVDMFLKKIGSQYFDTLIVSQPAYLEKANTMIKFVEMDAWKSFLIWSYVRAYAGNLSEEWEKVDFDFYGKVLSGKTSMKPKDDKCIDYITDSPISELLGKAFIETSFSDEAKEKVNKMVDNLLIVFQQRISNLSWMSNETKTQALKKLNAIGRKLGFPDKWKDFSSISLSKDNLAKNIENLNTYAVLDNFSKLNTKVDKEEWEMPAHLVNAYYHPLMNEIAFPAGIMQPPFFSLNYEDAVNYGRIGMVIGHEFTHGFDDNGAKYAADGSYTNWWAEEDKKLFDERTKTLGETYATFCPFSDHCVNPELTMGENIADLGGLTLAYHAYAMTEEFKSGVKIDGYTPSQRFFISYAQLWKINYKDEELKNRIATDYHSPGMFRVNGPLKNCPEFFEAFDVKVGDRMRNPEQKVAKIW
jgi:putative endopeptidase